MSQFVKSVVCLICLTFLCDGCAQSDPVPETPNIDPATGEEIKAIRGNAKGSDSPIPGNSTKSAE